MANTRIKDKNHENAKKLLKEIKNETKVMPLLMLSETITYINARRGIEVAKNAYDIINNEFLITLPVFKDLDASMEYLVKYHSLSLADSLAVHTMKTMDILKIYSFDDDFDKVEGILRVY